MFKLSTVHCPHNVAPLCFSPKVLRETSGSRATKPCRVHSPASNFCMRFVVTGQSAILILNLKTAVCWGWRRNLRVQRRFNVISEVGVAKIKNTETVLFCIFVYYVLFLCSVMFSFSRLVQPKRCTKSQKWCCTLLCCVRISVICVSMRACVCVCECKKKEREER